jgi:hypothetical protein
MADATLPDNAVAGTPVAAVSVSMSDGSTFIPERGPPSYGRLLLDALDLGPFGETAFWAGRVVDGRFDMDPSVVPLTGTEAGLGVSQTWFYCAAWRAPPEPAIEDVVVIRGVAWEIVEIGLDDIGELQIRLIKYAVPPEGPEARGPGRPSRRDEVIRAYANVARGRDPRESLSRLFPPIRRAITGSTEPSRGLTDKTLAKILGPLRPER